MLDLLFAVAGIGLLYGGGEALVRGAVGLAKASGLSPLVIGLTVVSLGTSSPELASTLVAAFQGVPDLAFANVVGSNIANLGLILGATALVFPLTAHGVMARREVPFMLLVSALMLGLVADDRVGRGEGLGLLALLALFIGYLLWRESHGLGDPTVEVEEVEAPGSAWIGFALVALGVVLLVLGASALIEGAVGLARLAGISERVIGLTLVAVGTSLPELASSVVAATKRHGDIVLGNLIGSNIFNILCILGATAAIHPIAVEPGSVWLDLGAMLALSLVVWLILGRRQVVHRWEGFALLAAYAGYVAWLF